MKIKLILISLCSLFLLSSCEKTAQEKLAEQTLAEKAKAKEDELFQKCSLQKSLSKSETAKEYGYEISQECVDYFKNKKK